MANELRAAMRLAGLVAAAVVVAVGARAADAPFPDIPPNHPAQQAVAALAAAGLIAGYPDGAFKGDRPVTRYELATLVARLVARDDADRAHIATRADLDQLQKKMDALEGELDSLGVRVTSLEDTVATLRHAKR